MSFQNGDRLVSDDAGQELGEECEMFRTGRRNVGEPKAVIGEDTFESNLSCHKKRSQQ